MRWLFGFLMALAVLAFTACGDGDCAEPVDVAGEWQMTATPIEDTCDGEPGAPYTFRVTITQEGNALTGQTPEGPMAGTICGDQIRMSDSWTEAGVAQTVNLELTISADGNSVEGSDTWTWTDATQSCGGSELLSGTNVDATCSPVCTVGSECTNTSFSECMGECAWWLGQAHAISSECAGAVRSQYACLTELTCAEFDAWTNKVPPDAYPCKSADDTAISVCL
jgi:hypothetical protein